MASAQPLILLVGMHRSGTSLAASLLKSLGVTMPGPWRAGDGHNQHGYHEWLEVRDLQEQLLIDLDRFWPSAAGTLPLPADWLDQAVSLRAMERLETMLRHEADHPRGPWAIKDPRTSLLLPLWRRVAERLGLRLRLVQALRDPAAVTLSLLERDGPGVGMTSQRAQHLWWHHHQRIRLDGEGLPTFTVSYETWFGPRAGEQLVALAAFCQLPPPDASCREAALALIDPHQRHHGLGDRAQPVLLAEPVQRLHRDLMAGTADAAEALATAQPEEALCLSALPEHLCLSVVGGSESRHWVPHAWLNRCPLPPKVRFSVEASALRLTLHLQSLARSQAEGRLDDLRAQAIVLDPSLKQVEHLRAAGVNAFWIDPQAPSSGWLHSYFHPHRCAQQLGLPDPMVLARSGRLLCLGSLGPAEDGQLGEQTWGLPRFDQLRLKDADQARLLASWLNRCHQLGLQLVRIHASELERHGHAFRALDRPKGPDHAEWLPAPLLKAPVSLEAVEEELNWRRQGCPREERETPRPSHEVLWQWPPAGEPMQPVQAAVCVTLFNYGACVTTALDSVRAQSLRPLELIVVDDGSTDGGATRVKDWLERHGRELGRGLLLQHRENGGLAAARNTAFEASTAPWCMVLDADNSLEPDALRLCLEVAHASPASTAMIHPLIAVKQWEESGQHGQAPSPPEADALMASLVWQREIFEDGNKIDAMALIRRESWRQVGGYVHSTAWTDYDLWCRFVEAGLHGVMCPQRLATYTLHHDSMSVGIRPKDRHRLKLVMQQRHNWLRLVPQQHQP